MTRLHYLLLERESSKIDKEEVNCYTSCGANHWFNCEWRQCCVGRAIALWRKKIEWQANKREKSQFVCLLENYCERCGGRQRRIDIESSLLVLCRSAEIRPWGKDTSLWIGIHDCTSHHIFCARIAVWRIVSISRKTEERQEGLKHQKWSPL